MSIQWQLMEKKPIRSSPFAPANTGVYMTVGLLIPGFAVAMGWLFLLHPRIGIVNQFLQDMFGFADAPLSITTIAGMDILVKSVQSQGRHVDRKVAFNEIADDRLATEVAKELGYKIP